MMPLSEGTSLRTFLSKMLNCHPMLISKKFVGSNYNGQQVYIRRVGADRLPNEEVKRRRENLCNLERKFLAKLAEKTGERGVGYAHGVASTGMAGSLTVPPSAKTAAVSSSQPQRILFTGDAASSASSTAASNLVSTLNLQNLDARQQGASDSGIGCPDVLNQAVVNQTSVGGQQVRPQNLSSIPPSSLGFDQASASSDSLHKLLQEFVNSTGSDGELNNTSAAISSTDSLHAFQVKFQQQTNGNNSGATLSKPVHTSAAVAGRALLQSGGELGLNSGAASVKLKNCSAAAIKDIFSSFSSDELAAELSKRSFLRDAMTTMSAATESGTSSEVVAYPKPKSQVSNNSITGSSLTTVLDMFKLPKPQGSFDLLTRLQSLQSLGSLLDSVADSASKCSPKHNSSWNPVATTNRQATQLEYLAARVSQGNFYHPATVNNVNNLKKNRKSVNHLANCSSSSDVCRASSAGSDLHLASLLHNEEALRQLQSSAPPSSCQNSDFRRKHDNSGQGGFVYTRERMQSGSNSAIAQFLLQQKKSRETMASSENETQEELVARMTAGRERKIAGFKARGIGQAMMSSLLSRLASTNGVGGGDGVGEQRQDPIEALKRKLSSQAGEEDEFRKKRLLDN